MAWRAAPWADVEARLVLQMAAQVLRLRLHKELREERALSYSFSCSYGPSKGYPAASLLSVAFDTTPEQFASQMQAVADTGIAVVPLADAWAELESQLG